MKKTLILNLLVVLLFAGGALTSCQQDNIKPKGTNNTPDLAADDNDPHPLPDPVCSDFDTIPLVAENGSFKVDYCGSFGTTPIPCPPTMPNWGFVEILNGEDIMICNFTMAVGWFIDLNRSQFGTSSDFQFNQNGVPMITHDWLPVDIDPVVNQWQLALPLDSLPSPCFDMSLQLTVVKLNFFSGIDQNSVTSLWGYNGKWNDQNSDWASVSPFVCHWCPSNCGPVFPPADSTCVSAFPGLPGNAGCVTLSPDVSGATGSVTYDWSNNATTASINVCPTTNTEYSVTVTDANGPYSVNVYNVVAQNVICTPGNRPTPKVLVCHYPPGNPNNPQTICIDWSGVPAHVEAFRTPLMNPNHGHDSGCHIGPCNSNPCGN